MKTVFTYHGHANLRLETAGFSVLVDPWFTGNPWMKNAAYQVEADFILVTHAHGDHLGETVEIGKRTGAMVIANAEICGKLKEQGLSVHSLHIGGGHPFKFGYAKLTPAFHGSAFPDGSYGGNPAGFLIKTQDGKKLYLAGDTGLFGDMALLGEENLDLAVLPIGGNFTMDPDDALKAVKLLMPKWVVPIHYNTFDLIQQDPEAWKVRVESETTAKVFVLQPGQSLTL